MSNKQINKAYVRFDGTGRIIPGSLILNRFKPKVGNWQEIDANECCNPALENFLLQESSSGNDDFILQEDGNKIIL
jgi:hypothetical protein